MTPEEFIQLVKRMRKAQKDFFSTHSKESLRISKRLETEVDNYLLYVPEDDKPQPPTQQKLL